MKLLLSLIKKLYGSKALQKSIGTRTNVITLPDKETKKFISNELNVDAASDAAVQKAYKDVEKLIPEIPKMNDQEILTFTNNLRRLDNRLNPPSAEVVEFGTKKPVSEAGIKQLAAERGFPEGVDPESTMGRLLTSTRKLQDEAEKLKQQTPSQQFEDLLKNPYRSGGPLDPKSGIVRTAARQILRKKLDAGEIDIPDAAERDAIAKGYQGGVDPIEVFRKRFGEDPLQDLDEIADELNRAGDFKEIDNILKRNKLFDIEPKKDYGYQEGSYTDEEMAALLKKAEEDPEDFATGGRVGFQIGGVSQRAIPIPKALPPNMTLDKYVERELNRPNAIAPVGTIRSPRPGTIGYRGPSTPELNEPSIPKLSEVDRLGNLYMRNTTGEFIDLNENGIDDRLEQFATGGRVGFALGSLPKGIQALAKQLNKKFGKGTIKTADEMERPKSVKEKEMFEEFEARNPDPKRKLTDDEIKDYEEELGDSETWMSEGTVEEAEQALKRQKEYEAAMYVDYRAGRLDPKPGEKGRKEFLEKKLEEMEMSGDKRLMTRDEIEELSTYDLGEELDQLRGMAPKMAERFELQKKYPGIDDRLLTQIIDDPDPQRKAEALAVIDQAFELMKRGKSPDEVLEIMKKGTDRTKQAGGGLAYLMGL